MGGAELFGRYRCLECQVCWCARVLVGKLFCLLLVWRFRLAGFAAIRGLGMACQDLSKTCIAFVAAHESAADLRL